MALIQNVHIKLQAKSRLLVLTPVSTAVQGYLAWKKSHTEVLGGCASRKGPNFGGQTHPQREQRAVPVELGVTLTAAKPGSAPPGQVLPAEAVLYCWLEEMQSCTYIATVSSFSAP